MHWQLQKMMRLSFLKTDKFRLQAVRVGDLGAFHKAMEEHTEAFKRVRLQYLCD